MQKKQVDSRLQRALYQEKRHFKMFKTGKLWATVGISLLFGAGFALTQPSTTAFAATAETTTATSQIATIASQTVTSPTAQLPQVTLASGWTAPTWQAADFDITAVAGKANTYTATLSAQGIAALQAANPNAKITAQNVQAGTLTVQDTTAQSTAAKSTTTTTDQLPTDSQASAKVAAAQTSTTANNSAASVDSSTSHQSTTATDSDQQSDATKSTASAPAVTALGGAATQADIDKAKTTAESAMKKTGQAQVITAMSGEPQDTDTPSTSKASITSSTDKIGYGSGVSDSFTLTITMTGVSAGDKVTFTLPTTPTKQFVNGAFSLQSVQDFHSPDQGTVEKVTNPDGTITVTDTIKVGGNYTQKVTLSLYNNYAGQALLTVGDTPYTVNVAVNGKQTGSTTFTMTVNPQVFLKTPTQTHPNTSVKGLLPNTDYVWEVPVNEGDGVLDQWYQSPRVNSAVNYGTTITIPTPAGFVLNQALTDTLNSAKPGSASTLGTTDNTTIKQVGGAGGDIIITVPKGSGSQYYDMNPAYRLAGHFETTQAATDTTLTAAGPVTMVQQIDNAGTTKTYTADPWKAVILGTGTTQGANVITTANGNSNDNTYNPTDPKQLVLNQDPSDDPDHLLQYSFQYHAAAAANNVAIRMTVPDGMAVNKIEVPAAGVSSSIYMPGTTSYSYVLTFADGTTATGTVAPGGTVTSTKNIRTVVFTPDSLAPGATSGNFKFDGTLLPIYDDGTAVRNGDQLTGTIDMSLAGGDYSGANSFTQTVAGPIAWPNVASNFSHTETAPGKGQGSIIGIWGAESAVGQNTYSVYEPIFYFDIPSAFVVDGVENAQDAVITTGTADNGDTVVKVDFTGTKESVDVRPYDWDERLHLDLHNAPDAMVGSYPWYAYVTSPTTSLVQTTKVTDLSQTMGDANAILVGTETWQIDTIAGTYAYGMAQGDLSPATAAAIDKNSKNPLKFFDTVMNISGTDVSNVTSILNLPQVGDDQGSTYTFNLTGPVTLPTQVTNQAGKTVPLTGAQALYSTTRADLSAATPDLSTYVIADNVTDWSTIKSVAFTFDTLPAGVTTGRIALTGTTTNMNEDAGKIGYLATSFYMGDGAPAVVDKAASIAITGQSTIHARAHYVDADGNDQYVAFPDLDKTYTDNQDTLAATDFPATPSDADIALIPTGYVLHANSLHFVDSSDDGVATVGQTVKDAFDGDFAQYELDKESSLTVSYFDDTTKAVVGTPETFTGVTGSTGTYTPTAPDGYILATGQPTSIAYTITADDTDNIVIHVVHPTTTSELETKRKITFSGITDPNLVPKTVVQTEHWQAVTDNTTGTTTYTLTTPNLEYTAPTVAGYHVVGDATLASPTSAPTTTKPGDTTHEFVYEADNQTADLKYVDDDKGGAQVGTTQQLSGKTGGTADWTAKVPTGYELASNQPATGTVTFTTNTQDVTIHLTHVIEHKTITTTRTITYTGAGTKTPEKVVQTTTWHTSTDKATDSFIATDNSDYAEVNTPPIAGYTPDQKSVAKVGIQTVTDPKAIKDTEVTVTYKADDQTAQVKYVDDVNKGAAVGTPEELSGKTDTTTYWTAKVPAGYELAKGQAASGTVTFTANTPDVVVHLTHAIDHGTATTTRTITYTGAGTKTPTAVVQKTTWSTSTDQATGQFIATSTTVYAEVNTPDIAGYTPDQTSVARAKVQTVTDPNAIKDTEVTVTYTADDQTTQVKYVDDDKGGAPVGDPETLSGKTDTTTDWTATIPTGYELAPDQPASGTVTFAALTPDVTVHLKHIIQHGARTTKRTITYIGGGAESPAPVVQTIKWLTSVDVVTGGVIATAQAGYPAVPTPAIPGYTPDQASAAPVGIHTTTNPADLTDSAVTVTYTIDQQTAEIIFVIKGHGTYDVVTVSGASGSAIPTSSYQAILAALTAKGYKVVTNAAKGAHFDDDRTATQRLTIVLTQPSTGGPNHGGLPETGLTGGSSTTTGQPGGTATGQATGTSSQQSTGNSQGQTSDAAHRLPTTGDAQGTQYAVLGLMFLTGIFGLAKPRKKHN